MKTTIKENIQNNNNTAQTGNNLFYLKKQENETLSNKFNVCNK